MASWLPIVKAVLPHVTTIITSAIPHFTRRSSPDVIPQQIAELQSATTKNAESVKVLAEQLEQIVRATEEGATSLEQVLTRIDQTNSSLENRINETAAAARTTRLIAIASGVVGLIAVIIVLVTR